MKTFDTKEEAEAYLDKLRLKDLGFCPIINAECRKDCVAYSEGWHYSTGGGSSKIDAHEPSCLNVLICGEINVNNQY